MIPLEYGVSAGPPCFIYSCHIVMSVVITACIPLTLALLSSVPNIYCLDEIHECREERITPSLAITHIVHVPQLCSYTARLKTPLETSSCLVLAVRAYNKVGLYSTITHQLRGCDVSSKVTLTVVDAVATTQDG